jgi:uncharacterized protein YbaR (Trm112 family)/SAM-dependent methyltransferase
VHLLLTDRVTCPRCGPRFGLILLAERVVDRRVLEGHLGCPNCREHYPVRKGYGDLRPPADRGNLGDEPPEASGPPGMPETPGTSRPPGAGAASNPVPDPAPDPDAAVTRDVEGALRLAALLGVERGPGFLLVMGAAARLAGRLAAMVEGIEVVAVGPGLEALDEDPGVSRMAFGPGVPFYDASFQGVALQGNWIPPRLGEALRVLRPGSRIVLLDPAEEDRSRLEEAGLELLLVTGKALVAVA